MDKQALKITDKATPTSVLLLLNPFSAFTGLKLWMPESVQSWAVKNLGGFIQGKLRLKHYVDDARQKGHLIWKAGVGAATAALAVALFRAIGSASNYTVKGGKIKSKAPYGETLNTARDSFLSKKVPRKKDLTQDKKLLPKKLLDKKDNLLKILKQAGILGIPDLIWLPPAAIAAASILAYNMTDKIMDKADKLHYKEDLKLAALKMLRIQIARAALARRNLLIPLVKLAIRNSPKLLQSMGKTAAGGFFGSSDMSWDLRVMHVANQPVRLVDLACAAVLLAAGIGSYSWFADRNPARRKLLAAQKAQKLYIKTKALLDSLDRPPMSRAMSLYISGKTKPAADKKQQATLLPAGLLGLLAPMDLI